MNEESPEAYQARIRQAERTHDEHNKTRLASFTSTISFGAEALKAAALINGGSAAATLALVSQTLEKQKMLTAAMIGPLQLFAGGLFVAVVAMGLSYISQIFFTLAHDHAERTWHRPWIEIERPAKLRQWVGLAFQGLAVLFVLTAYGLALWGFLNAAEALKAAARVTP